MSGILRFFGGAKRKESDTGTVGEPNISQTSTAGVIPGTAPDASPAKKQKLPKPSKFLPSWKQNRPWLKYVENQGMFCTYCQMYNKVPFGRTTWNTTPSVRLRLQTVKEHEDAVEHKDSARTVLLAAKCKNVATELTKPIEISSDGMLQAFKCLYFLSKNNIAHTTNFPKLLEFEKHLGVDILAKITKGHNAKYTSSMAIKEMLSCISAVIETETLNSIRNCDSYSLMFDETTDTSVIEQLVIHARYIEKNGDVTVKYLKILDALAGDDTRNDDSLGTQSGQHEPDMNELKTVAITLNAETICRKVTEYIEKNELDYTKLRGIGTDGAAVMTGKKNGAVKKIIDKQAQHQTDENDQNKPINRAVGEHCAAHKLNLAAKHAGSEFPAIQRFKSVLRTLHAFYSRSAVRDKGLLTVQELLKNSLQENGKIGNPSETRWLALGECALKLKNTITSVIMSLEREAEERADTAAAGLVAFMTRVEFIATLVLLCEILPTINRLSAIFQTSKVDFSAVKTSLLATVAILNAKKSASLTESITHIRDKLIAHGVTLHSKSNFTQDIANFCLRVQEPFINKLIDNIQARFIDTDIMASFSFMFNPESYTSPNLDQLCQNLKKLCQQFALPTEEAISEVKDFIFYFQAADSKALTCEDFLAQLTGGQDEAHSSLYATTFPLLCKLARIYKVLPPHTADCERDFSRVKLIKTSIRNRMGEDTLDYLLRISIEGPPIEKFQFGKAVKIWANEKERRYKVRLF